MKLAAFVFGSLPLVMNYYSRKYTEDDKVKVLIELEKDFGLPRIQTYDFVVVGAGTAGCVVAGRLSEKFNVLLLDAGGSPIPQTSVPHFTRDLWSVPDIHFTHKSVPQRNLSLTSGGIVNIITGKMLGGSGSHNDMIHQRGSSHDWNAIASLIRDSSWSYENLIPLFKRSENFVGQLVKPEEADYYGNGGPITVDTHIPAIFDKWVAAGLELGYPTGDPNARQIPSFTTIHKAIRNGTRSSTYTGYIKPFENTRKNLTVLRYSQVTQILLDEGPRAYGVTFLRHGIPHIAHASKEVILSAGTINSPLILMMSGIGPSEVLQAADIPVKVQLANVGQNLQEHIYTHITDFTFNASAIPFIPRIKEADLEAEFNTYLETGAGEFGEIPVGPQAFFVSSRAIQDGEEDWPDFRIVFDAACPLILDDEEENKACFIVELDRPKSKGSVSLNTTAYRSGVIDLAELSVIDLNAFGVPSDMDVVLEGIEAGFKIFEETDAFRSLGTTYSGSTVPACSHLPFRSTQYWSCYAQMGGSGSTTHFVGTCAMGSVTDSDMKIIGVRNLRVIDASVLPIVPNANVNGAVILVGEKGVQSILKEWGV